jgi:hypothetical protein
MGQGTLLFTNQLLLRVFTCNSFGLRQLIIYTSSNIHSTISILLGPSAYEGPQKQDLTVFLEHNV